MIQCLQYEKVINTLYNPMWVDMYYVHILVNLLGFKRTCEFNKPNTKLTKYLTQYILCSETNSTNKLS